MNLITSSTVLHETPPTGDNVASPAGNMRTELATRTARLDVTKEEEEKEEIKRWQELASFRVAQFTAGRALEIKSCFGRAGGRRGKLGPEGEQKAPISSSPEPEIRARPPPSSNQTSSWLQEEPNLLIIAQPVKLKLKLKQKLNLNLNLNLNIRF